MRHTFPSKAEFLQTEKIDADRLRNYYMTGRATVDFLELHYLGCNKPFLAAVMALGLMAEPADVSAKRAGDALEGGLAAKKARS